MNTLISGNNIVVLHDHKPGNNFQVASIITKRLGCDILVATDTPELKKYDIIIVVSANAGDEELPAPMENFLANITLTGKSYLVVEIGNYFGFKDPAGCWRVITGLLDKLNWKLLGKTQIDSVPCVDIKSLEMWLDDLQENILRP